MRGKLFHGLLPLVSISSLHMVWGVDMEAYVRPGYPRQSAEPGNFKIYVMAMSWKAEWCYHQSYPGCALPEDFWKDHLTLHGLWPDYGDGTYPTMCTQEPFDPKQVEEGVGMEVLLKYWPNVQAAQSSAKYIEFWEHEWSKHGTCTGLTQVQYFKAAVALLMLLDTPPVIKQNVGKEISRTEIEEAYGGKGMAVLTCDHRRYLSQVYLCYTVGQDSHMPLSIMPCPAAVVKHDDNCDPFSVVINSF